MVLHAEHILAVQRDAAIGTVEQRDMGLGHALGQGVGIDGEAMVHRDDLDLAGGHVLHRMVGAVMAVGHLHGLCAHRQAQHLVAQANAEHRRARGDDTLDGGNGINAGRRRIARTVRQQHAVRLVAHHLFGGGAGGNHGDVRAHAGQQPQDVALDAIVDDHGLPARPGFVVVAHAPQPRRLAPLERLGRGHVLGEVEAFEPRKRLCFFHQHVMIGDAVADGAVRHALFADQRRQRAGVDPRQRRDVVLLQPAVQRHQAAIVGRMLGIGANNEAAHHRRQGLDVLVIGADNADVRKREGDDLPGVGRIGQDFLVASHGGVEADLAHRDARRAEAGALEAAAIGQHQRTTRKSGLRDGGGGGRCVGHGKPRICAKIGL